MSKTDPLPYKYQLLTIPVNPPSSCCLKCSSALAKNLFCFAVGVAITIVFVQHRKLLSANEPIRDDYGLFGRNVTSLSLKEEKIAQTQQQQQPLPTIFLITPTYDRSTQLADLTRLAQTLRLVPSVCWIVIEDSAEKTRQVTQLLARSRVPYVHLNIKLDPGYSSSGRGAENRNMALDWLRTQYGADSKTAPPGVIYLADDDNAYDVRVFEEMRSTERISAFPVGHITVYGVSAPIVNRTTGRVVGFHDYWCSGRVFCMDMAGFAINLGHFLAHPKARMAHGNGEQEDSILLSVGATMEMLEPKASNCTEVLVWHVRTEGSDKMNRDNMKKFPRYEDTYLPELYQKAT